MTHRFLSVGRVCPARGSSPLFVVYGLVQGLNKIGCKKVDYTDDIVIEFSGKLGGTVSEAMQSALSFMQRKAD